MIFTPFVSKIDPMGTLLYDRKKKCLTEIEQYGGGMMRAAYHGRWGQCLLLPVVISPLFTRIYGWLQCLPCSRKKIPAFIKRYHVEMRDYQPRRYRNFDEFFLRAIREGARPMTGEKSRLIAPADSKLLVYPVHEGAKVIVKGVEYSIEELAGMSFGSGKRQNAGSRGENADLADFAGGLCLVFRLTMDDYHHYCFPDDGRLRLRYQIKGKLHTVSPLSAGRKIYRDNYRVVNLLETRHFGKILMIEVGAMFAGCIRNRPIRHFKKGEEKGYFRLGGSSILMLLQKDQVALDADIMEYAVSGTEVKLRYREDIGSRL